MPNSTPDQDTAKGATETEDHKKPGIWASRNSLAIATQIRF
jgi:hypothetical protein